MTRPGGLAALVTAGVVCAALTACTPTDDVPAPTGTATLTAALTFDDGASLDTGQVVSWTDPLAVADGYTREVGDSGGSDAGASWSYASNDTGCVIGYWQGPLPTTDASIGDAAATDELLAAQFGGAADEIAEYVEDGPGRMLTRTRVVQTHAVLGADRDAGVTYLLSARAFGAIGAGFVATLQCPDAIDVAEEWDRLNAEAGVFELFFAATE